MCVCLFLMYLYTYIYIYFNEQKKPDFFVTVSWLTYAQSYSAHTSSETYVVAEALVRALSNVFSSVYYCHWKTTLIFFSVRAFIGSFFLPKHMVFQKTYRHLSFNFYPSVRIRLKLINSFKSYSIKHGQAQTAVTETKKGHVCFWHAL